MDDELLQAQEEKNNELVYVFNPTKNDFTTSYDVNENGHPQEFTIRSREGDKFKRFIADHIAKKLKDEILGAMKNNNRSRDLVEEEIYKTIKFYE